MKTLLFMLVIVMTVGCTSVNPLMNDDKFEDYNPWWATNSVKVITNRVSCVMESNSYVFYR